MCSLKPDTHQFVDVVLPLAVPQAYTYTLPDHLAASAEIGKRVVVQLGARKLYTGVIANLHSQNPHSATKAVLEILDDHAKVTPIQLEFWQWLAKYYMCTLGEILTAAMPAGLKLASESKVQLSSNLADWNKLGSQEQIIVEALENNQQLTVQEVGKLLALKNPMRIIHDLVEADFISLDEELGRRLKPKTHAAYALAKNQNENTINAWFEDLKKAPKQHELLLAYFKLAEEYGHELVPEKKMLNEAGATKSSLEGLLSKGILRKEERLKPIKKAFQTPHLELSEKQAQALNKIKVHQAGKKPVLLHGVTSSGKTEIYISLIKEALARHKRALYLVPEIALTTQLIQRLQTHFGDQAVVYHSRISQRERLAAYERLLHEEKPLVLLGARSALLLPLPNLGIIIIDEEHDPSFKQQDPAPRYHARDAALVLAKLADCPILLGSATPSVETYFNAKTNKYGLVELAERFGGVHMPKMEVVDVRKETLWKSMHGHYSPRLLDEIKETLEGGKRVILFQNRRGYSPIIQCHSCGHTQECTNCDITLTYHKYTNLLKCHYCGYTAKPPNQCPECGSTDLREKGFGTEKLEEELGMFLPDANIERLDLDKTRRKNAFNHIISRFEDGKIDVLIGTQMVTKGLDFDDVTLVGILSADSMLHYPDFRAQERAFQLMEQVAGRAGRRNDQGRVTIQSFRPDHRIIDQVLNHDYIGMVKEQLKEREVFRYPPFVRLIQIELRHRDFQTVQRASHDFAHLLSKYLGNQVLGPEAPPIGRLKNVYRMTLLIKMEKEMAPQKVKEFILSVEETIKRAPQYKSLRCIFDVDPY